MLSERERGAASRVYLGQPSRSSPSPEVRQKRGGASIDSGEWTEVRRRGRNGRREDGRDRYFSRQTRQYYRSRSSSTSRNLRFNDQHPFPYYSTQDRNLPGRLQNFYSDDQRGFARHGNQKTSRYASGIRSFRSRHSSSLERRLNQRDFEEENRRLRGQRDLACFNHSNSSHRRRRKRNQGDRRVMEDVKAKERAQQHGGCSDDSLAKLEGGGGRYEGGKAIVGGVDDGRCKGKEVGDGVQAELKHCEVTIPGSNLKRYISFYFSNFPAQLPKFYLRKSFEVCGILEDVYVAKKRNKYGQPYGFVKFSNVKNVSKMTKALNNVWFGNFRVKASVALFDRNVSRVGRRMEIQKAEMEQFNVPFSKDGKQESIRLEMSKIEAEGIKLSERHSHREGVSDPRVKMEISAPKEGVRVGNIIVELGARKVKSSQKKAQKEGNKLPPEKIEPQADTVKDRRCLMKSYRTKPADAKWASNGVVATIINGEAVPLVQDRIVDAGFNDLVLIPMGADKVFLRSSAGADAMWTVNNAKEFFQLCFSNWSRWETDAQPYRRGAWVRLYGIPLHASNEDFFKLCVFYCGRFMRTDCCSAEKDRLDFARVLIATPDLNIINRVERVLVDGGQVEVKIVEEWGYAMGEDCCLVEEESESEAAQSECGEGHVDPEACREVDMLINNISEGLEEEACDVDRGLREEESLVKLNEKDYEVELEQRPVSLNPVFISVETSSNARPCSQGAPLIQAVRSDRPSVVVEAQVRSPIRAPHNKCTNSCSHVSRRSVISGPWSLEWLNDQNHGDAGVIFSASKKGRKGNHPVLSINAKGQQDPMKRKASGVLRHPLHSIKKVARMPTKDRSESSSLRGESSSSGSINNDWKNWVVVQGNDQMAVDDVWGIGKAIEIKFKGDNVNMFNILSRAGKGKKAISSRGSVGGPQRLGGLEKRKEVGKLVGDLKPFILCLQETKLQNCDVFLCSNLWGSSSHGFSFRPLVGASGGILTLWDSSEVEMWWTESREHVLWCYGRFTKSGEEFCVANIYAPCDDMAKQRSWETISERLHSLAGKRVCVCGDFNVVKHVEERRSVQGGHRSLDHVPFSRFIEDNTLVDLPLIGRKFTWFKGDGLSMSRLDRFLLSKEWCLVWPNCRQVARLRGLSDHCPLVLSTNEEEWGPRPSRMLKCWKDVSGYHLFVREKWNSLQVDGWGGYVLKEKLKLIKAGLKEWHKVHTQNLHSRIDSLKARLSALDEKGEEEALSEEELVEFHGVSLDIHSLSRLHASISWQQSRSVWLKDGDANSKYFHSVLASRHRRNAMSAIQVDGVTIEGVEPIRQAVFSHFESHFKASNVDRPGVDDLQFKRLNHVENGSLIKPFTEAEVKSAVWDCDSFKSPGPDGINFGFIKDFWTELRGDIMRFISEFHRNGKLTKGINSTFIALIPKVDSPQRLNDFRPISLVGCLYKILAKVLANRLRLVIGSVISEAQTAFIKDRQILDGILVANEVVDEARRSKKELMLFKVDFEKAYDSVDWGYLDDVMGRMSFPALWRKWIRECVCTATTSVLVNGSPTDEFPLRRGLRQGGPLSPFLLAAEGLNVLMEAMVARNLFTGYISAQGSISVSHLQFADDTLLLGVKSWANVRALRVVLVLFETMS
ncbi:cysteine-rich receptor-like protein kinase, partial [Trifolium pratense]